MEEFFSILGAAASDCLTNHKFWGRCRKQGMQRAGEGKIVLKAEKPRIAPKFAFSISQISSGIALQTKFPTWVPRNFLLLSFHNFSLQLFFLLWMGLYLLPRCICGQFYIYLQLFVHIHNILLLLSYWCLFFRRTSIYKIRTDPFIFNCYYYDDMEQVRTLRQNIKFKFFHDLNLLYVPTFIFCMLYHSLDLSISRQIQ